jgi:hypothetical protein
VLGYILTFLGYILTLLGYILTLLGYILTLLGYILTLPATHTLTVAQEWQGYLQEQFAQEVPCTEHGKYRTMATTIHMANMALNSQNSGVPGKSLIGARACGCGCGCGCAYGCVCVRVRACAIFIAFLQQNWSKLDEFAEYIGGACSNHSIGCNIHMSHFPSLQ